MPFWNLGRIEADQGAGIPDVLLKDGRNRLQFIELKILSRGNKIKFQPSQVSFLAQHAGSLCWVLIENLKSDPYTYLLYSGGDVLELSQRGILFPALLVSADLTKILKYIEEY
jgi:hypothetical protein